MLKEIALKTKQKTGNTHLYAHDFMDDGSKIALTIEIDETHVCKDISMQHAQSRKRYNLKV